MYILPLLSRRLIIVGLVEEEVCGELLILVAGKVRLDSLITVKAKAAELCAQCQSLDLKTEYPGQR